MNQEKLKEVIEKAKAGDKKAKNIIINDNMKYIKIIANKFRLKNRNLSLDDLIQDGVIAVIKAINSYDINKDVKFNTYVYNFVTLSIISNIKKKYMTVKLPQGIHVPVDIFSLDENINEIEILLDKIKYEENKFDYIDDYLKWEQILKNKLTILEKKIILKTYFENKTVEITSNELNINKRKVSILKHRAIKKIKKFGNHLEEEF
ncbi:sigma-70 family RNA polymerase sigma factor [Clostridium felsineum]|uniref:RNA polymerase sigma factor RpoS n=1 Tax=Clostridium felsineum TaxID=36839 RepID=A0A1S8LD77_9CLOT|nr:sigma-70 family RNA polymerase sigma factor [Clostridium felsineum]URZ05883.1 RNA polymerase sigma factor RpoS [Clostridium felsineum]URZ10920.1 RNA polymerase sigma factor RpoS [Clostridium felsineum]